MNYFPLLLDLNAKKVVVIGGGAVAERKVRALVECGARVTVVAPRLTGDLQAEVARGRVAHEAREYRAGDLDGARLAFIAVDDACVSSKVAGDAEDAGVLVNVADRPELCSFIVPSVLRRGRLTIAISTGGASPAWARKIRVALEGEFGEEYARLLEALAAVRGRLLETTPDPARRREALRRLADDSALELARSGSAEKIVPELLKLAAGKRADRG